MIFNGWDSRCHPVFAETITDLYQFVSELKDRDPEGYKSHIKTRFLARIYKIITEEIPSAPFSPRYYQGNTLGPKYREWKRAKFSERYRLFFKYSSERKLIIDAWMNDEDTLRKQGSSTDPYKVFKRMLDGKVIQDDFTQLEAGCICPWTQGEQHLSAHAP